MPIPLKISINQPREQCIQDKAGIPGRTGGHSEGSGLREVQRRRQAESRGVMVHYVAHTYIQCSLIYNFSTVDLALFASATRKLEEAELKYKQLNPLYI